ncbi:MAG TPA: hypothetical protein VGV85_02520, partial [Longimicrobiaceae bacterium]|nr:hypothetical protein [Longimicrobiaceae bacterium]
MSSIDYGVSPDALLERIADREREIAELKDRLRAWETAYERTPKRESNRGEPERGADPAEDPVYTSISGTAVKPLYTPLDRPETGAE